ncbi:flagellar motor switch protein FliG, partial [bacterium]
DQARSVLEAAFGADKADETMKKIVTAMQVQPFEFLRKADPAQVLSFIQDEHPQTISLILSYMPVNSAAVILSKLPTELRGDVASRIAMMEQTPPEVVRRVEQTLEKKVANVLSQEMTQAGGPKALVDLLNRVDRQTERLILEALEDEQPDLAEQIKNMMFVFEDIVQLDDRAIQAVLREVDMKELATALKGVGGAVSDKIFRNMSERAVGMLKEDMEFMGPVRLRVVEEAQQKIVASIRKLEESGEITVSRSGEDDQLV